MSLATVRVLTETTLSKEYLGCSMELTFILDAVRRYFWFIPLFGVLFALPGLVLSRTAQPTWEAVTVLSIVPAVRDSPLDTSPGGDRDRYVAGQIAAMGSVDLAEDVADRVGDGVDAAEVSDALFSTQVPGTDIVRVEVTTDSPQRSQEIANSFAAAYLDSLASKIDTTGSSEFDRTNGQLLELRRQIAAVDDEISTQMARFVDAVPTSPGGELPPIPALEQVVPALVSEKTILLTQYEQILTAQTELDLNPELRVASEVLQPAALPLTPILPRTKLLAAAGMLGGIFLGVLAAVVAARLSPRLLSVHHASEIIGQEVVATIPRAKLSDHDYHTLLRQPPVRFQPSIRAIGVLAEASARRGASLAIVVAGVDRGSGTTTLSMALANRFVAKGLSVILADLDTNDPRITMEFAPNNTELAAHLRNSPNVTIDPRHLADLLTPTETDNLSVLGVDTSDSPLTIRRSMADDLVRSTATGADVVIFDVGALMDASSSLYLAQAADVVVLAIPDRAHTATLTAVTQQLRVGSGQLLPVITPTSRTFLHPFGARPPRSGTDRPAHSEPFVEHASNSEAVDELVP